jgi:hypothetical protein
MDVLHKLDHTFIEKLTSEPVDHFSIKKGSEKGDNVAGEIHSLEIHTTSKKILQLVYKILPLNNPMLKEWAIEHAIFGLEIEMYTRIASKVEQLVKAHDVGGKFIGALAQLPIPKFYDGLCTGGDDDYLILADERPAGFKMSDKYVGYNLAEMALILKELARFHAFTYFMIKYEGEQLFQSSSMMEKYAKGFWNDNNPKNIAGSQEIYSIAIDSAIKILETKIDACLAEKVKAKIDRGKVGLLVRGITAMTDGKIFPVIVHGGENHI